ATQTEPPGTKNPKQSAREVKTAIWHCSPERGSARALCLDAQDALPKCKISEAQRTEMRNSIPQPILAHYDRLVARGKKGVAVVRNQVCTGCHMRLPIGPITTLMQDRDIQLCDSCGRVFFFELKEAQ